MHIGNPYLLRLVSAVCLLVDFMKLTVCDGRWSPKRHLLYNHCICTCDFFCLTFVSCLLTITLHIVDVHLTLNKYYLFTSLLIYQWRMVWSAVGCRVCLCTVNCYCLLVGMMMVVVMMMDDDDDDNDDDDDGN